MKTYTLYWRDGKKNVVTGSDPVNAMNNAGYGVGAIAALGFYAEGEDEYTWNAKEHRWSKQAEKNERSNR